VKKQRHWKSAAEIEKAIDSSFRKRDKLRMCAQTHLDMEALFKDVDSVIANAAAEQADILLGKINRLENTRLKKLQRLLAEFKTVPLGAANGVEGLKEESVVLQKI
jgi:hypothetical protein